METLTEIHEAVSALYVTMGRTFRDDIEPGLEKEGISFSDWSSLDLDDRAWLDRQFSERIFPVLTPLAVDPAHPFPYVSDLSLSLAVFVRQGPTAQLQFARVKVPPILPRFIVMPDGERFVPVEQLIAVHLDDLFKGMEIVSHCPFRVTRDADREYDHDDGGDDLLEVIEQMLTEPHRRAVRLEVERHIDAEALRVIRQGLEVTEHDIYAVDGPLDMTGLWALYDLDRPELKQQQWTGITSPELAAATAGGRSVFSVLRRTDVLVHHPYESFATSVEAFIAEAARDPKVLTIKMAMYRTAEQSPIVKSLIEAAAAGKQVVVLVELKARFDEEANIEWARVLEQAGVHVAYGVMGLKTHCKTALVV